MAITYRNCVVSTPLHKLAIEEQKLDIHILK